jgi:hypothetical protein
MSRRSLPSRSLAAHTAAELECDAPGRDPPKDKRSSAQLSAEIFGLTVKPSEGRFAQVPLDEHLTIDFADDEHTRGFLHFVPEQLESHHYAFHITDAEFDGIFGRVKAKGLAYGSGPTTETDGQVADRRGGNDPRRARGLQRPPLHGQVWHLASLRQEEGFVGVRRNAVITAVISVPGVALR